MSGASKHSTNEPCRQIRNTLSDELMAIEASYTKREAADWLKDVAISSLRKAMVEGDIEGGAVMAGQIVPPPSRGYRALPAGAPCSPTPP
jgi:enoyl-[acyl-carrier protein] reductase II